MCKAKREGKILIDWLRNKRGATAVVPYSARARELAPEAVPITLDKMGSTGNARSSTINDALEVAKGAASPLLKGWGFAAQMLPSV